MSTNIKLGDPSQDSYVTATMAESYMDNRRDTTEWDNLSTTNKEIVLKQAAQDLEIFNYIGEKYYDSQGLSFPRDNHDIVTGNCATPITLTSFRNSNLYSTTYNKYPTNYWKYGSCHITVGSALNDIRLVDYSNVTNGSITVTEDFSATPSTSSAFKIFAPIDTEIQNAQCEQVLYILKNSNIDQLDSYRSAGARRVSIGDVTVEFSSSAGSLNISSVARKLLGRWIQKRYRIGRG